ncbi:MAG TPA: adenylate/guanylate cyclase domain-containing protein, partial [Candidatus Limnocylindria bacterium]|nr:adenylate/guanylate cyclase domain-containing protein [Candidatus Limnocylindria bacterium]
MRADLPDGTVTFLFTDIEGSTRLLHELGAEAYAAALAEHRRILRAAFTAHGGVEVDTQGDAFFVAFPTASGALDAARRAADELASGPIQVRMGIHTGTPHLAEEGYVGVDVHRAARIAAAGHGGQVLVSSAAAALLPDDALLDLGPHRLKDLAAPERIFQLGDAAFPPLKSLYATNLPIPTTPFVGRGREVDEIGDLLGRSEVRLVTLTGPGGTGKTRLALQAAGEAGDGYPDGVWWVELADIRDGGLVAETVATIIGARDGLARHIGQRRMLLVIDNAEHLLDAVAEVAGLRSSCPNLELLVTSREPLHVHGEHEYPVQPMSAAESYHLFMTRARAVRPDASDDGSVAAICARLDHLPLALELAAARTRLLAPRELLLRLEQRLALLTGGARDQPGRMRTLRATIDWSHDLLTVEEQVLFRRLSVLRTWKLEDAEAVVDADLDTLGSLVDKSLVRRTEDRFWILETIREYAAEQLAASGELDQYLDRHARHFHGLALAAAEELQLGRSASIVQALDAEVDNLRGALERLMEVGDAQMVLAMLGALPEFWDRSARPMEGYARTSAALELDARPTPARAQALLAAAFLAELTGDLPTAERWAVEALALHRALGDPVGEAVAKHQMG